MPGKICLSDLHYQLDAEDHLLCNADGSRYTGIVYEASPNGYVTTEYEVKNGLRDGVEKEFYSDGSVEHETHYRHGLYHGDIIYYYSNGLPKEKSVFEYDIFLEGFEWDELGNLLNHNMIPADDARFQKVVRLRERYAW